MAKLKPDPITPQDIVEYLKAGDDFSLEMRVLRACSDAGFEATHGGTYRDPVTGKDRQFDIRALLTKEACTVKLAIECKNLKPNYPLIVSRVPRNSDEAYHGIVFSKYDPGKSPEGSAYAGYWPDTESMYGLVKFIGKATVQVGRNEKREWISGDAEVYEKWAQAVSSAVELVQLSVRDNFQMAVPKAATVVLPILVVADGSLFTADYESSGNLLGVHGCEECYLYLGKSIEDARTRLDLKLSHLGIFTETKFSDYLNRLAINDKYWKLLFPENIDWRH